MTNLEIFENLSTEDKNKILDEYLKQQLDDMQILELLLFKCAKICIETNADNMKLSSELKKVNKKATIELNLVNLQKND